VEFADFEVVEEFLSSAVAKRSDHVLSIPHPGIGVGTSAPRSSGRTTSQCAAINVVV
jgi:hypothetical protein